VTSNIIVALLQDNSTSASFFSNIFNLRIVWKIGKYEIQPLEFIDLSLKGFSGVIAWIGVICT
jgi:hypothetical protein